jgi:Ser/Thr protein kinase RdoA (MazF antagonist)
MRVPACVGVAIDHEEGCGVLIMRDLVADGARFCSALEPFTPGLAAQSLEQIARLHVASALLEHAPWVPCRIQELAQTRSFTPEGVQTLLDDPRGEGLPARTRSAALLFAGMRALADRNANRPQTLLHGDCHAGNLYLTADGPGFTDWQLIQHGNWAFDVAYHIAAILPVDVAEREERALLDHYLATLRSLGGETPGREDAWDEYRRAQVYGYFHWAITRRVEPRIIRIFIERLGAGVTRHETYRLLGL